MREKHEERKNFFITFRFTSCTINNNSLIIIMLMMMRIIIKVIIIMELCVVLYHIIRLFLGNNNAHDTKLLTQSRYITNSNNKKHGKQTLFLQKMVEYRFSCYGRINFEFLGTKHELAFNKEV